VAEPVEAAPRTGTVRLVAQELGRAWPYGACFTIARDGAADTWSHPIAEGATDENGAFVPPALPEGSYRWRIRGVDLYQSEGVFAIVADQETVVRTDPTLDVAAGVAGVSVTMGSVSVPEPCEVPVEEPAAPNVPGE
jgi:hypothetical protein